MAWARALADERVWALEDCRHVSGSLERFLLAHGETVIRVSPQLMGDAVAARPASAANPTRSTRWPSREMAVRDGIDTFPAARLAGPELEIRLLHDHRARLVADRTALINDLRWHVFDLWPDYEIAPRTLGAAHPPATARAAPAGRGTQRAGARRTRRTAPRPRAHPRDQRARTRTRRHWSPRRTGAGRRPRQRPHPDRRLRRRDRRHHPLPHPRQTRPRRGAAPIPVWSGHNNGRLRLDIGGNRRLNHALHLYALSRIRHDPATAAYIAKQRARGKTHKEAIRLLKRHLVNRVWRLLQPDAQPARTRHPLLAA